MSLPLTTPPEHICILRLSAIGDVTHVLPIVRSIQHQWPQTKISWIIGKLEYQLVGDIDGIEFFIFDKSAGWPAYKQLWQQLKDRRFDVLLHMQISLRASLASLCIRAPIRLGFDKARSKNLQSLFCNHFISAKKQRLHVLDVFFEFADALGIKEKRLEWNIPIPAQDSDSIHQQLDAQQAFIAINPCTSNRTQNWRNWDIESYAAIIDFVYEHYQLNTVLTGGPDALEKDYARQISQACQHKPIDKVGQTSLKQLCAIFQQSTLVIAPDTGPMHMANALGKPVIGLFATSNPLRTGPYSNLHNVVNMYPQALQNEYQKSVDQARWGKRVRNPQALQLIQLDDVKKQLKKLLTN